MTDLTIYRYALVVRDLVYKKQRHDENPRDSRFEWDDEFDLKVLQDFSHFLNISLQPSDPNYFTEVLASVQEIISAYNQTVTRNTPTPELKREYEEYLKKLETPEKKNPLPPILKRLYPGLDDSTLELISKLTLTRAISPAVSFTLPSVVQDLRDIGIVSGIPSPDTTALVVLDTLSPWFANSPEFNQILSATPAPLNEVATLIATSTISGINFAPTDTLPAILNSRFSPQTSQKISSHALSNQKLLIDFLSQAQAINQVGIKTNYQLAKQAFLSGTPLSSTDQAVAATVLYNYIFPAIGYFSSLPSSTPASRSPVEEVFARLGLNLYEKDHGNVKNSIRQAVTSFRFSDSSLLYSQPVQSFYASKYASSPALKGFFSSLTTFSSSDPQLQDLLRSPLGEDVKKHSQPKSTSGPTISAQDFSEILRNFVSRLKIGASRVSQEAWFDAVPPALLGLFGFLSFGAPGGGIGLVAGEGVNFFRPGHFARASNFASSAGARLGTMVAKTGAAVIAGLSTALAVISIVVVSIPIIIALILFIINSSAFVVPLGSSSGIGGRFPSCWPVLGVVTQGPPGSTKCYEEAAGKFREEFCSHSTSQQNAIDIGAAAGTQIFATHDGIATSHDYLTEHSDYGNYVTIDSPDGFQTIYGHMQQVLVTSGTPVKAGQLIGLVDSTGNSTGDHLHYEIRPFDKMGIINKYVPAYTITTNQDRPATTGCFAQNSGGSNENQ